MAVNILQREPSGSDLNDNLHKVSFSRPPKFSRPKKKTPYLNTDIFICLNGLPEIHWAFN